MRRARADWRMDVQGAVPADLASRGVDDAATTLPGYAYRDDALLVYDVMHKYVTDYVDVTYANTVELIEDEEIQAWAGELVATPSEGGLGIKGVPGNGAFDTKEDLVSVLTSIMFACSAGHAAANFMQYDYYGYPPAFPSLLRGEPPRNKVDVVTEATILAALPGRQVTLDAMSVTQVLSQKDTNCLAGQL